MATKWRSPILPMKSVATDQQVLGYLISNMSSCIQSQLTACKTVAETWRAVEGMFSLMT